MFETDSGCQCLRCLTDRGVQDYPGVSVAATRMILCAECGSKRCPNATDCRLDCTKSNEPGQYGSQYGTLLDPPWKSGECWQCYCYGFATHLPKLPQLCFSEGNCVSAAIELNA